MHRSSTLQLRRTVFENHRESLIQHCERSKLRLPFEWTKVNLKIPKNVHFGKLWKPEACGQTVLPDRSVLTGQKLVEMPKVKNSNATFWVIFKQCVSPKKLTPNIKSGSWTFRVRAAVASLYLRVFLAFIFGLLMSCLELSDNGVAVQFGGPRIFNPQVSI